MSEELFDVCDAQDQVIGQAARSYVHAHNLLHRAVHVWIWNSRAELMIHLRSHWKDQFPLCFTSSSSGHVDAGETYETAAHRELFEELQLRGTLTYVTKLPGSPETAYEHTMLFQLQTDTSPVPDPSEIQEVQFHSPAAVQSMLAADPERFTPPFRALFGWWVREHGLA